MVSLRETHQQDQPARDLPHRLTGDRYAGPGHPLKDDPHSTVTDLARFRGWSTSHPRNTAMW